MDQNISTTRSSSSPQCINCQSAPATMLCKPCDNHYCAACSADIHQHRALSKHHPVPIDQKAFEILLCAQCLTKELDFFCHNCSTVICGDCLLSMHKQHNFVSIDVTTKDVVTGVVSKGEGMQSVLDRTLKKEFDKIDTTENINIKKIQGTFTNIRNMLNEHEQRLQERVSIIEQKNKTLIESYHRQLLSLHEKEALNSSKLFTMFYSTKDYEKGKHVKDDFSKNLNRTLDEMRYLQPPVRIQYDIKGLDQLRAIEQLLNHIHVVEEELSLRNTSTKRNSKLERYLADDPNCKKQILRAQQLTDQDMIIVSHLLRETTTLTNLDLSSNQIGANGVQSLATALLINTTLTHLNLSHNCINDQGVRYLADMLYENTTLTKLYLDNNQIGVYGARYLADALKINKTLTTLDLADNDIGDDGVQHLAEALKTNQTLNVLNVTGNYIQAKGTKYLAHALTKNTTLTKLSLSGNIIQDEGAIYLGNAFRKETVLTALYIADNGITERGARYLLDSLRENVTLSTMDYQFNQIGDDLSRQIHQTLIIITACKRDKEMENIRLFNKRKKAKTS